MHLFGVNIDVQDPSESINFMNNQNIFKNNSKKTQILDKNDTFFTSDRTVFQISDNVMTIRNSNGKFYYTITQDQQNNNNNDKKENKKGKFLNFLISKGWFLGTPISFIPPTESNLDAI